MHNQLSSSETCQLDDQNTITIFGAKIPVPLPRREGP